MDYINKYFKNIDSNFFKNYKDYTNYFSLRNIIIFSLILYIAFVNIYTPRHIISFLNLPITKICFIILILYSFTFDQKVSILLLITFLITINLEFLLQNDNRIENYKNHKEKHIIQEESDNENSDSETDSQDKNNTKENFDSDTDSSDDESDSDLDESNNESDSDESENEEKYKNFNKVFNPNKIKPAKNLDDNFTNLHKAMHSLESFIKKK